MAELLVYAAALLTALALLMALARFVMGPHPADRVVAFDVITIVAISGIILAALAENRGFYLDVALVYALLSFLGVIVIARFLEKGF